MPDTPRSEADLIALLPNAKPITAQDVRDLVVSVFTLAAKGDLAGIDVAGLRQALSVSGNDGWVLTEDAASALGFKWASSGAGHTEDHDHDGSPTQKLLAANTHESPSADTHHAQSHAHNGADSSGTVAGSDLTGTPGGELGGTWASPTVDATHSGSTHSAATDTHIADTSAAHAASAVSVDSTTLVGTGTDVQAVFEEMDNDIAALKTVDYLVGTATGTLSGEIAVGTTPGGELGGTWASPTVDATHSGSTHAAATTTHEAAADPHTGYVLESLLDAKGDLITASADNTPAKLTVGANGTFLVADSTAGGGLKYAVVKTTVVAAVDGATASTTLPYFVSGPMAHAGTILNAYAKTAENKTIGATAWVGDVHLIPAANANTDGQGTSIFTTKPTITNGNMYQSYGAPDLTTAFAAGDYLAFYTDQAGTNATFITMTLTVEYAV